MSNWRDPDESRDHNLPSRKDIQDYDDTDSSGVSFFSRISIIIISLLITSIASWSLYKNLIDNKNLIAPDFISNNKIAIALEDSLKNENFRTADILTRTLLYASIQNSERYLGSEDLDRISCETIKYIDDKWKQYSNDKFGLTVQIDIWKKIKNEKEKKEIFGKKVGWYIEEEGRWLDIEQVNYSLQAQRGHLPTRSPVFGKIAIIDPHTEEKGEYATELDKAWLFNSLLESSKYPHCFKTD